MWKTAEVKGAQINALIFDNLFGRAFLYML